MQTKKECRDEVAYVSAPLLTLLANRLPPMLNSRATSRLAIDIILYEAFVRAKSTVFPSTPWSMTRTTISAEMGMTTDSSFSTTVRIPVHDVIQ
jgi:hypothetical protein